MTWETYNGAAEYVRRKEICTALKFVKLKLICIEYHGISVGEF